MKAFEKIAEAAVLQAEKVSCPLRDFVQGLRDIRDEIQHRLELAEDELRVHERESGESDE
jgi:hypothetical protein